MSELDRESPYAYAQVPSIRLERLMAGNDNQTFPISIDMAVMNGATRLVVNTLPEYIPEKLKDELIASHPDPDIRFQKITTLEYRGLAIPEYIRKDDIEAYKAGLYLINEVVTQSLTIDMLKDKIDIAKAIKTIPSAADGYIQIFTGEGVYPLSDKNVGLMQHLQVAYLSGKRGELDSYLQNNYGFSGLESFFVNFGRTIIDLQKNDKKLSELDAPADGKAWGMMSRNFPGRVIVDTAMVKATLGMAALTLSSLVYTIVGANILAKPLNPEAHAAFIGITSLTAIIASISGYLNLRYDKDLVNTTIGVSIHEIVHYLSTDFAKKRCGFIYYK